MEGWWRSEWRGGGEVSGVEGRWRNEWRGGGAGAHVSLTPCPGSP